MLLGLSFRFFFGLKDDSIMEIFHKNLLELTERINYKTALGNADYQGQTSFHTNEHPTIKEILSCRRPR
jgi:hypothetical protein